MKDSTRINNWLTFVSIVILSITLVLYSKYVAPAQQKKASLKAIPLCEDSSYKFEEIVPFNKIYGKKIIKEGLSLLKNGDYTILGGITLSKKGDSKLKKYISLSHSDKYFLNAIEVKQNDKSIKKLSINYEIVEYDKQGSSKNNLPKGYILTSFRINNKQLYRIQSNFYSYDKQEIKKRIKCTIGAFKYNAKI